MSNVSSIILIEKLYLDQWSVDFELQLKAFQLVDFQSWGQIWNPWLQIFHFTSSFYTWKTWFSSHYFAFKKDVRILFNQTLITSIKMDPFLWRIKFIMWEKVWLFRLSINPTVTLQKIKILWKYFSV